jgi:D-sedoheptulose 7-phosphate isomerase
LDPARYVVALGLVEVTAGRRRVSLKTGMRRALDLIRRRAARGGTVWFAGNGGSAAIASHMATDFWKNGGIRALAFNDASLLTCLANDCGYERVFEKPLGMFARRGDVLVAISSSGRSENILRAVAAARRRGAAGLTFSGFRPDNPLRRRGDLNFYVPAREYGPVEIAHNALIHCLLDAHMATR